MPAERAPSDTTETLRENDDEEGKTSPTRGNRLEGGKRPALPRSLGSEAAFVDLKLALARSLHSRRERKGLTQNQLAELIESSQSRVAKMEAGDRTVSLDLLVRSLLVMGTTKRELARIIPAPKRAA